VGHRQAAIVEQRTQFGIDLELWTTGTILDQMSQAGEAVRAEHLLADGIAVYQPKHCAPDLALYGYDTKVLCLAHRACTLAWCGYLDSALSEIQEAISWATRIEHPWSVAVARHFALRVHQDRADCALVSTLAEENIAQNERYQFPFFGIDAQIMLGWARCATGGRETGLRDLSGAVAAWPALGAGLDQAYHFLLLADACRVHLLAVGSSDSSWRTGLNAIKTGFEKARNTGECCWNSELYRLRGEFLAISPEVADHAKAVLALQRALQGSRKQGTKLFELRAAHGLAKLWRNQGKGRQARELLEPLYLSFTEGLDTPMLREVRQCLDSLG
jgi:predicted ATPase